MPFPVSRGPLHILAHCPSLHFQHTSFQPVCVITPPFLTLILLLPFPLIRSHVTTLSPSELSKMISHVNIFKLNISAKPLLTCELTHSLVLGMWRWILMGAITLSTSKPDCLNYTPSSAVHLLFFS